MDSLAKLRWPVPVTSPRPAPEAAVGRLSRVQREILKIALGLTGENRIPGTHMLAVTIWGRDRALSHWRTGLRDMDKPVESRFVVTLCRTRANMTSKGLIMRVGDGWFLTPAGIRKAKSLMLIPLDTNIKPGVSS